MFTIVPVVEGDGEVEAVPVLLRKILGERCQRHDVQVAKPKNGGGRPNLDRKLERLLKYAVMTPGCDAIVVVLDSHADCPKELASGLAERARNVNANVPIAIVCANREYEAWFLASLETVRGRDIKGRPGLSADSQFGGPVEDLSDVKKWLTEHMPPGRAYKETADQSPLSEHIDLNTAYGRSRSFRRLCHAVEQLLQAMEASYAAITP